MISSKKLMLLPVWSSCLVIVLFVVSSGAHANANSIAAVGGSDNTRRNLEQHHHVRHRVLQEEQERGECDNDPDFRYKNQEGKDCASWALEKPDNCRQRQPGSSGGKQVKFFCPQQCKKKCFITDSLLTVTVVSSPKVAGGGGRGDCENEKNYELNDKDCKELAEKGKCNKEDTTHDFPPFDETTKKVKFFCPEQCKSACTTTTTPVPTAAVPITNDAPTTHSPPSNVRGFSVHVIANPPVFDFKTAQEEQDEHDDGTTIIPFHVGQSVFKVVDGVELQGHVVGYDPATKLYRIVYEDDDNKYNTVEEYYNHNDAVRS